MLVEAVEGRRMPAHTQADIGANASVVQRRRERLRDLHEDRLRTDACHTAQHAEGIVQASQLLCGLECDPALAPHGAKAEKVTPVPIATSRNMEP